MLCSRPALPPRFRRRFSSGERSFSSLKRKRWWPLFRSFAPGAYRRMRACMGCCWVWRPSRPRRRIWPISPNWWGSRRSPARCPPSRRPGRRPGRRVAAGRWPAVPGSAAPARRCRRAWPPGGRGGRSGRAAGRRPRPSGCRAGRRRCPAIARRGERRRFTMSNRLRRWLHAIPLDDPIERRQAMLVQ